MSQWVFTHGVAVLLAQPISLDEVATALADFELERIAVDGAQGMPAGMALSLSHPPNRMGPVIVDILDTPWPISLERAASKPDRDSAAIAEQFGPSIFPGSLGRAMQLGRGPGLNESVVAGHQGVIRLRVGYPVEANEPAASRPLDELSLLASLCEDLLALPPAICYFNPVAEAVRSRDEVAESLDQAAEDQSPPLDLLSNIRLFKVDEQWSLMDTAGHQQFALPDLEALFRPEIYSFDDVFSLLRGMTIYLLEGKSPPPDRATLRGPHDVLWQVQELPSGLMVPPRRILRFRPADGAPLPPLPLETSQR